MLLKYLEELMLLLDEKENLVAERKENIRKVWNYEPVDHIPVVMSVDWVPWEKTYQQEFEDGFFQLQNRIFSLYRSLECLPDDYIPTVFLDVGCVGIAEAFGGKVFLGDNPEQTPGIEKPRVADRDELEIILGNTWEPDFSRGLAYEYLKRASNCLQVTNGKVYISGLDFNGPIGVAMDLLGSSLLFELLLDEDPLLGILLGKITKSILTFTDLMIKKTGSVDRYTTFDFFWYWCPVKGHVSSDVSSMYAGNYFEKIEKPFLEQILNKYGGGLLHNCGPNPCTENYASLSGLRGINVSYRYSKGDLKAFRRHLAGKVIYFFMDDHDENESIEDFTKIMDQLAPDVIGIPIVSVLDPKVNVTELYCAYRRIAQEYAYRVFG